MKLRSGHAFSFVVLLGVLGACTTSSSDDSVAMGEDASLSKDVFQVDQAVDVGVFRDVEVTDADRDAQTLHMYDVQVTLDGGETVRDAEIVDANLGSDRDTTVMDAQTADGAPRDIGLAVDSGCEPNCPSGEICNGVDDDLDERVDERDGIEGDVCPPCVDGTFDHDLNPLTACIACSTCAPDAVELSPCTPSADRQCLLCAQEETFDASMNACRSCAICEVGTTRQGACTTTSDTQCEVCPEGTYDHDQDAATACVPCDACRPGTTEVEACSGQHNRRCEACDSGTYDHDGDPNTPCMPCEDCPESMLEVGVCTATESPRCVVCDDSSLSGEELVDARSPGAFESCVAGDALCENTIDLVVFYDETALEHFGGEVDRLKGWSQNMVAASNRGLELSLFPPDYRYRLVGLFPMSVQGRSNSVSTLVTLRFNEHYQSLRRSVGGDLSVFLSDQSGSPMGYSYFLYGPTVRPDRGAVVMKVGFTAHPNRCGASGNALTFAHELGHILGANHNRATLPSGTGTSYAYHNQEPHHRRNEAYGHSVDQHEKAVYTLMSYNRYRPGPNNETAPCAGCERLPMFASPDLWWFFDPADALHGTCLVISDTDPSALQLACSASEPYALAPVGYELDPGALVTLSAAELVQRSLPLGRDMPQFVHPDTGEVVSDATSTRARDMALEMWLSRAQAAPPLDVSCDAGCEILNRVGCGAGTQTCGACLPDFFEASGECKPRILSVNEPTLNDNMYNSSGVFALPEDAVTTHLEFDTPTPLEVIEVYLGTTDGTGMPDFEWSDNSSFIFGVPAAPPHSVSVTVETANGETISLDELEVGRDSANQHDHSLTYRLQPVMAPHHVVRVTITIASASARYGIELLEVRAFGSPLP
ncbi:MAG: M12 family metallo-peptidase [Bradymonadia bacterium]